jgi:hypothetical protein
VQPKDSTDHAHPARASVLNPAECDTLIGLLKRLHENLPEVESATDSYIAKHFPQAPVRRRADSQAEEG